VHVSSAFKNSHFFPKPFEFYKYAVATSAFVLRRELKFNQVAVYYSSIAGMGSINYSTHDLNAELILVILGLE
jgi:hypothetical protein